MITKQLGQTGLEVTPIGLGLAALGRPGYINLGHSNDLAEQYDTTSMRDRSHEVLDTAWDLGIRYFDTARSYGKAEAFLGNWLKTRQIAQSAVTVGSKWGYVYTADWQVSADKHEIKDHSLANLNRQIDESSAILSPYLRLYQVHSATQDSGVLANVEVLYRLGELRDELGLVIGLSLSGAEQADTLYQAMAVEINGRPLFGAVQATWNLLSQEVGNALKDANAAGLGVIVKEALANGRLTTRNNSPDFQRQMSMLNTAADLHHTTVDALAIAAVLAQPWSGCVLSGAATSDQLRANCRALDVDWTDDLAELADSLAERPEQYWATRSSLQWN